MVEVEIRILSNQIEIMWALSYLLAEAEPDLVGRGGALDRMRNDLGNAAKDSLTVLAKTSPQL